MLKRIYHDGTKVVLIEADPTENYTNDFHPYIYLKDQNDPSQGYENIPQWFVMEDAPVLSQTFEFLRVRVSGEGMEVYFDQEKFDEDEEQKRVKERVDKDDLDAISDPAVKRLLKKLMDRGR